MNHLPDFGWSPGGKVICCQSHSRDLLESGCCGGPGHWSSSVHRLCWVLSLVQTFAGMIEQLLQSVSSCNAVKTPEECLHLSSMCPLAHSAAAQSPQQRVTGTLLTALAPPARRCFCQGCNCWATWGSVKTPIYSPLVLGVSTGWSVPSSCSMIKIFTAQWVGLAAAPKLCSW